MGLRARYRRENTSRNNNNSLLLIARSKEKIYTHTHTLRYIIRVNVGIIRVRRLGRPRQERLLLETQNPILATDATTVGPIRPVRLSQMARVGFSRAYVHLRAYFVHGYYIVTYGLGIYNLNLMIGFLSPARDPSLSASEGPTLPSSNNEEYRPFVRKLPEFKFWVKSAKSLLVSFSMTFFPVFDVPVFWPI